MRQQCSNVLDTDENEHDVACSESAIYLFDGQPRCQQCGHDWLDGLATERAHTVRLISARADQPAPTTPPSAVAWAQGYLQSTNDGYSGRTSPNPYRGDWAGSDGESEGEAAARGGCCGNCGGKSHTGACVYMRPELLAREALASARLDVETHCLPEVEGPRGAREATAGWPVEEPGVLQRLRAEPQGAPDELCAGVVEVGRGYLVLCELPPEHEGPHSSER